MHAAAAARSRAPATPRIVKKHQTAKIRPRGMTMLVSLVVSPFTVELHENSKNKNDNTASTQTLADEGSVCLATCVAGALIAASCFASCEIGQFVYVIVTAPSPLRTPAVS